MGDFLENPHERRWFDSVTKRIYRGNVLAHIAGTLTMMAQMAPQEGSYAMQLKIMANEVAKAGKRGPKP